MAVRDRPLNAGRQVQRTVRVAYWHLVHRGNSRSSESTLYVRDTPDDAWGDISHVRSLENSSAAWHGNSVVAYVVCPPGPTPSDSSSFRPDVPASCEANTALFGPSTPRTWLLSPSTQHQYRCRSAV